MGTARTEWVPVAITAVTLAAVIAVFVALSDESPWPLAIVVIIVVPVLVTFRSITVTVDRRELIVRYAPPLAFRHRIARRDIESVEVVDVRPRSWGGWGYRGSRKIFGRAAVLIRRGPGLEVTTRDGKKLTITVDDPEGAAAALDN